MMECKASAPPGGDSTAHSLEGMLAEQQRSLRDATAQEIMLLTEYARVCQEQETAENRRAEIENALRLAIGDSEGLVWPAGRLTWKLLEDRKHMDWESLARTLLTNYIKDQAAREALLAEYTRMKPGSRRLSFRPDAATENGVHPEGRGERPKTAQAG